MDVWVFVPIATVWPAAGSAYGTAAVAVKAAEAIEIENALLFDVGI